MNGPFAIMDAMERIYLVSHEILNPFLKIKKIQKQTVELSYLPKNELNISPFFDLRPLIRSRNIKDFVWFF